MRKNQPNRPLHPMNDDPSGKSLLTELQSRLRTVVTANYADLKRQFDDICGYAICAPPYFEQIFPAYQLSSALRDCPSDSLGLNAYFPPEWESFGTLSFGDEFDALTSQIHKRRCAHDGLEADAVFDAILDVLIDLERQGVFGPRSRDRFITMWNVGDDESLIIAASEKLNSAEVHSTVLKTFGRNS